MGYAQALNVYKETKVKTASQGALIVMLYEEAIKHMDAAAALVAEDLKKDPSKIEKANTHILKAQEIVTELAASLNMDEGGEIAKNLMSLYTFFLAQLSAANFEKKPEKILAVRGLMNELLSAWNQIASSASAAENRGQIPSGINIAG
ncbi:MAG: flagellar export chaperone FliS [Spirochaetes bacterium]|uniref:Flagellar secretion chaperone FliS n=1 Tax=Candidatus Avitreponema avistercoris TaxID=2840705 RepID=A0A9D9HHJ1_9SPIR|nr:flagellar export chaperone FliS [Candidatus Avitreponema avistercoris]